MKFAVEEAALGTCRNVDGDRRTPPDAAMGIRPSLRDPWPRTGLRSSPPSSRDYAQSRPRYRLTSPLTRYPPARTHTSDTQHNAAERRRSGLFCILQQADYNHLSIEIAGLARLCSHRAAGFTVLRNSLICFSLVSALAFSIQRRSFGTEGNVKEEKDYR